MARASGFSRSDIDVSAARRGAIVSGGIAIVVGLGIGSWVDEASRVSLVITAVISCGFVAGGAVAAATAARNPLVNGAVSALPVAVLAVGIQTIRLATEREPVGWIALLFLVALTVSLSTLGAVFGSRMAARRRSLLRR